MTTTIGVQALDPTDALLVEGWLDVFTAWAAHDRPYAMPFCRRSLEGALTNPLPGMRSIRQVAVANDQVLGLVEIELPDADNSSTALIEVVVHPSHRSGGIGRKLFEAGLAVARGEGRSLVMCETGEPWVATDPPPGRWLLESYGANPALENAMSVLDLDGLTSDRVSELYDSAATSATGYAVEHFVGPLTDESVCGDIAALEATLSTDAPMGELDWERENWDAVRVREQSAALARRGLRTYTTIARHLESGRIVAETMLVRPETVVTWAGQWTTVVDPGHRGHRLGLLIKMANLRLLAEHEPAVRHIETFNAVDNAHMLAVNDAMGFRRVERWWEWQLPLGEG